MIILRGIYIVYMNALRTRTSSQLRMYIPGMFVRHDIVDAGDVGHERDARLTVLLDP